MSSDWDDHWSDGTPSQFHDSLLPIFARDMQNYFSQVWDIYRDRFRVFSAPLVSYYLASFGAMIASAIACITWSFLTLALLTLLTTPLKSAYDTVVVNSAFAAARFDAPIPFLVPPPPPPAQEPPSLPSPIPPPPPPAQEPPSLPSFIPPPPPPPPYVKEW